MVIFLKLILLSNFAIGWYKNFYHLFEYFDNVKLNTHLMILSQCYYKSSKGPSSGNKCLYFIKIYLYLWAREKYHITIIYSNAILCFSSNKFSKKKIQKDLCFHWWSHSGNSGTFRMDYIHHFLQNRLVFFMFQIIFVKKESM